MIYTEGWADIKGYEGLYRISDEGRVVSCAREVKAPAGRVRALSEIFMKLQKHTRGYDVVFLSKQGVKRKHFVHRLVADAFIPNPENLPMVNHKKGDKHDNRASEIEWSTFSNNTRHYYRGVDMVEDKEMAF